MSQGRGGVGSFFMVPSILVTYDHLHRQAQEFLSGASMGTGKNEIFGLSSTTTALTSSTSHTCENYSEFPRKNF